MSGNDHRTGWGAFPMALVAGCNWRVWLIWLLVMLVPTALAVAPLQHALGSILDHSLLAQGFAAHFNVLVASDTLRQLSTRDGGATGGISAGLLVTLIATPFLTGVIIAALRAVRGAGFGELMHGALAEYWRLLRLTIWSLLPYGIAITLAILVIGHAHDRAADAILESVAKRGEHVAFTIAIVLVVLAHALMESARAQFVADANLRSATVALWRGAKMLALHPLATLGMYLGTSIIGYLLLLFAGMWRIHTPALGGFGTAMALVLGELLVVILAWQRTARLAALAAVARAYTAGRSGYPTFAAA